MSILDLIFPSEEQEVADTEDFDYQRFEPDNWSELTDKEKLDVLQELGNSYAQSVGIENPPQFVEETNPALYGGYSYGTNVISVNLDLCENPFEAMDTVIHEENHALQGQAVDIENQYVEGERALIKAEIGPAYYNSGVGYQIQNIELDSNNVAAEFVMSHSEGMQDSKEYQEYIDGRLEYFNNVNETLETSKEYCDQLEHEQTDTANKIGAINDKEKSAADTYIDSDHRRVRENSAATGEHVKENSYQSSLEHAEKLHDNYEQFEQGIHGETAARTILNNNEACVEHLNGTKASIDKELGELRTKQNAYICEHNYGIREALNDTYCQEQSQKISELETRQETVNYHITELQTDNQKVNEHMGWSNTENIQNDNSHEQGKSNGYEM